MIKSARILFIAFESLIADWICTRHAWRPITWKETFCCGNNFIVFFLDKSGLNTKKAIDICLRENGYLGEQYKEDTSYREQRNWLGSVEKFVVLVCSVWLVYLHTKCVKKCLRLGRRRCNRSGDASGGSSSSGSNFPSSSGGSLARGAVLASAVGGRRGNGHCTDGPANRSTAACRPTGSGRGRGSSWAVTGQRFPAQSDASVVVVVVVVIVVIICREAVESLFGFSWTFDYFLCFIWLRYVSQFSFSFVTGCHTHALHTFTYDRAPSRHRNK